MCSGFPPVNATGIHRTVALCRHLAQTGAEVLVLTMRPGSELPIDMSLLEKVPPGIRVVQASCLEPRAMLRRLRDMLRGGWRSNSSPGAASGQTGHQTIAKPPTKARLGVADWLSWWLQTPDSRIGWLAPALWMGLRHARSFKPSVIYSSAPMWTTHLIAMTMSAIIGCPWVADCRDPWRANPYRSFTYRAHDRADAWLEGRMVRRAAAVICNTQAVRQDFAMRYPAWANKFTAIENGYDAAVAMAIPGSITPDGHRLCRLVHAGGFYGVRSPEPFFQALAELARREPAVRGVMRFRQVGPTDYGAAPLADLARKHGVEDMLELAGTVCHTQALREIADGDVAVAAGQFGVGSQFQIPRKFYEYFGLGKPILVTGGSCQAVRDLLGGPVEGVWFVDDLGTGGAGLVAAMEEIYHRWQQRELRLVPPVGLDLTEQAMARRITQVLIQACRPVATIAGDRA